jgi:pyrimidine deaminase RibD-like protein
MKSKGIRNTMVRLCLISMSSLLRTAPVRSFSFLLQSTSTNGRGVRCCFSTSNVRPVSKNDRWNPSHGNNNNLQRFLSSSSSSGDGSDDDDDSATSNSTIATTTTTTSSTTHHHQTTSNNNNNNNNNILSDDDIFYLSQALDYARLGAGHTFPNPAVGCVLVKTGKTNNNNNIDNHKSDDNNDNKHVVVLGAGFHPRAGYPHAEVFALLQAAGHVPSGVAAARAVVEEVEEGTLSNDDDDDATPPLLLLLQSLMEQYSSSKDGPRSLFGDIFQKDNDNNDDNNKSFVTAYVTLEPCCHYGRTPPCAFSLALAKVDRVVVGFRDPNPQVNGGGVQVLQNASIPVDVAKEGSPIYAECARLVENFVKRIVPKTNNNNMMNGSMRRVLRTVAGRKKTDGTLVQVHWTTTAGIVQQQASNEEQVEHLELPSAEWMERLDGLLWREELVNLRLNKVVSKKKLARLLGERVATALGGVHVAQCVGHTVLLYRPGVPPVMDLAKMAAESKQQQQQKEDEKESDEEDKET